MHILFSIFDASLRWRTLKRRSFRGMGIFKLTDLALKWELLSQLFVQFCLKKDVLANVNGSVTARR